MDDYYDFEAAGRKLYEITKERISLQPKMQLAGFAQNKDGGGLNTAAVQHLPQEPIEWRLTNPSDGSDEVEEVVLRIQGILCEKDLPPVKIGNKGITQQARYLRQSVTMTGLNNDIFAKCLENISALGNLFLGNFSTDQTMPWNRDTYLNYDAVTFANRYYTDVTKHSYLQSVPFTKAEDPTGKLSSLKRDSGLLHCEENVVKYFFLQENRTTTASPSIFASGDIVEALVSFVMLRREGKYCVKPIVRGLTMIDNSETRKAMNKRNSENPPMIAPPRLRLKRKVGYEDQDSVDDEGTLRGVKNLMLEKDVSM